LQDILTSLVLPHQIYKRIMTRTLRKTTYAAIQQAVDIAYRLEEDTINVADTLLDRFVESQIREMVMLYPAAKNGQRRSHTILIDASEDHNNKKRLMMMGAKSPNYDTATSGNNDRRGRGSQVITSSIFGQKRHSFNDYENDDGKFSHRKNQGSVGKAPEG